MRLRLLILPLLVASLLLVASASAWATVPAPAALHQVRPGAALSERFLSRGRNGEPMLELMVEGDVPPGLLRARGMEVNTVAGRWMTVRCPVGLLQVLLETSGVRRVQVAERATPHLDRSAADAGATGVRTIGATGFSGLTGKGVVVGLVDTGVDLAHADFRTADGRTRFLSVWDQTATGTPPSGFTYGAESDSAQINAGLSGEQDTGGHGSHVLGIAAGDGRGTGNGLPAFTYVGVAPEADLIAVKTDFTDTRIVDGVSYIFQKAAALGKKAVVNLSVGSQQGPHDGTDPFDQMISALTGPGRIVVASAGNDAGKDLHGHFPLASLSDQTMTLSVPAYTPLAGSMNDYLLFTGWYPGADQLSLTITTPGGTVIGPVATGGQRTGVDTPDGYLNVYNGVSTPSNGDREIYVELYDNTESVTPASGTWQFRFSPAVVNGTGAIDMYTYGDHLGSGALARWVNGVMAAGVVATPGSADSVITVAAHSTRDGWDGLDGTHHSYNPLPVYGTIAYFSSPGPRRDGALKPDLSAPGHGVLSTKSSAFVVPTAYIATDGVHTVMSGTSMSAPHVTGAVALLLSEPYWSGAGPAAIRARLQATARTDSATGTTPNPSWGYGKLDVMRASADVVASVATRAPGASRFVLAANRPNPFNPSTTIRFELPERGRVSLRVYSMAGRLVRTLVDEPLEEGTHEARWDGRDAADHPTASGVYVYELTEGSRRLTHRMTLLK
ncbi:MAG: S8 family serine peptidase [Bacteroidota bacterium]